LKIYKRRGSVEVNSKIYMKVHNKKGYVDATVKTHGKKGNKVLEVNYENTVVVRVKAHDMHRIMKVLIDDNDYRAWQTYNKHKDKSKYKSIFKADYEITR